jgi:hypothetical protein
MQLLAGAQADLVDQPALKASLRYLEAVLARRQVLSLEIAGGIGGISRQISLIQISDDNPRGGNDGAARVFDGAKDGGLCGLRRERDRAQKRE